MRKLIRPTYPKEFSIGMLALIFVVSCFLSHQIFTVPISELNENKSVYFGMFLVGVAVITMILIIWEEFLFRIKVKLIKGGMLFRNHSTKLLTQLLIYCLIPAVFTFIYLEYEVNIIRFSIWAAICIIAPLVEKLASGLNNYNDFLRLTTEEVEYKNNEKEGCFKLKDIQNIIVIKDEKRILHKIELNFKDDNSITIDLDEMELEAFYGTIDNFMSVKYRHLLKTAVSA